MRSETTDTRDNGRYLLFKRGQQLSEQDEFARVQDKINVQLVGADGGVLLAQAVQLEVRHHFHVFLDQGGVRVIVARLLRGDANASEAAGSSQGADPPQGRRSQTFNMSLLMAFSFSAV